SRSSGRRDVVGLVGFTMANPTVDLTDATRALRVGDLSAKLDAIDIMTTSGTDIGQMLPEILRALKDPHRFVRQSAARALGTLTPHATAITPLLVKALRDTDIEVRREAAISLGRLQVSHKSVIDALTAALLNKTNGIQTEAAIALGSIGGLHAIHALLDGLGREIWEALRGLALTGPSGAAIIRTAISDPLAPNRAGLAMALISLEKPPIPELTKFLLDEDPDVRFNMVRSIEVSDFCDDLVPPLSQLLVSGQDVYRSRNDICELVEK